MNTPIQTLNQSIALMQSVINDESLIARIEDVANLCDDCNYNHGKIMIAGNGGSAALADHMATELLGRFYTDESIAVVALTNPSVITSIGNDYGFDSVFSKQIEGLGREGDVFIAFSTSGNSLNLIEAVQLCKKKSITTVCTTGSGDGLLQTICDINIVLPSKETPRVQECQGVIVHIICEMIKKEGRKNV